MTSTITKRTAFFGLCAALSTSAAVAVETGDFIVRAGAAWVLPNDSSSNVTGINVPTIPNSKVDVNDAVAFGINFTYMVTDNIGIELLAATPFSHDLEGQGSIAALGTIGETKQLPPTLTLQYHFNPHPNIKPYLGVGINYTTFFSESTTASLDNALGGPTSIELEDSWGASGELGVDFVLNGGWLINASAWYTGISTTATLNTAGAIRKVDVDINPWVLFFGVGKQF